MTPKTAQLNLLQNFRINLTVITKKSLPINIRARSIIISACSRADRGSESCIVEITPCCAACEACLLNSRALCLIISHLRSAHACME
eukprot:6172713-Pleurochrysis_carterae.AAC.1